MSDHRGDFKIATYNLQSQVAPVNDFLLGLLKQSSVYRFKQIFAGVGGVDWNGSGPESAKVTFYRGDVYATPTGVVSGIGVKVGEIPVSLGQSTIGSTAPYNRLLHVINFTYAYGGGFRLGDVSGGTSFIGPSFDLEIDCDYMALTVSWAGNLWGGGPTALLASRGFTHPPKFYHEFNYEYYL